jgi:hypothetical protein
MLDKEAGGALDNLQRRYERDQDATCDKTERGQQQYINDLPLFYIYNYKQLPFRPFDDQCSYIKRVFEGLWRLARNSGLLSSL